MLLQLQFHLRRQPVQVDSEMNILRGERDQPSSVCTAL
jgi:hypothetical protein